MRRTRFIRHRFVGTIPDELEEGVVYVSIEYGTAVHKCCCGCGQEVVTPLSPTDWRLIYDGETISLSPSIGNWSFACQSHYLIVENRVRWARRLPAESIQRGRKLDLHRKQAYYAGGSGSAFFLPNYVLDATFEEDDQLLDDRSGIGSSSTSSQNKRRK